MKILIVYNSALDPVSFSGVLRYFADVVVDWNKDGHEVDFWAAKGTWPLFRRYFPNARLVNSDGIFRFSPNNLSQTWRYLPAFGWRMITPYFAKLPVKYDVVLACAQFIYEAAPAMHLARASNAILAAKIHHVMSAQRKPTGIFDRLNFWSERVATKLFNRHFQVLLCSTQKVANDFNDLERRLGLKPSRVYPTGYGVRTDSIPYNPEGSKEFDAILLGRVHQHKGVFDMPAVWAEVRSRRPGARLAIVGEGPHRKQLAQEFEKLGMGPESNAVHFSGGVSDEEKNRILGLSRIGLSLSREEGWGLSVTEFLAAGLPVVAMEIPIFHDVFPNQFDMVPMGATSEMAKRILFWLDRPLEISASAPKRRAFAEGHSHHTVARAEFDLLAAAVRSRIAE
jgi:glycosyltransferase involved in cell wall biosynthesis